MPDSGIHEITFFGPVNEHSIYGLIDITFRAKQAGAKEIILRISSTGGNLHSGFAAYNHLRSLGVALTAYNFGNVESAAILLYLAASRRLAAPLSTFLLHEFSWGLTAGDTGLVALREYVESLEFDRNRYAEIFDKHTQKGFDILGAIQKGSVRLSAADAVIAGLVTSPPCERVLIERAVQWWVSTAI